ncbi:LytTR family two component transcriptional regulator [Chitinophaga skermanii]|uniref:LytTR family two component transcriptional regulator n=1 Tax=Chitinophaga skermanii TaxID=331697 RepID=A0A327QTC9_9BACT|nr:LytTR family DNA-binding domain-containing protein [Chitinophaga skermanii]RAJ06914.1 LytTR family two component transcriptional regulator [Chitinophaga skermanii]
MKAIAIDDEIPALQVIESFCAQTPGVKLLATFHKPSAALAFLAQNEVDLLFLDINMPAVLGTEFYRDIKQDHLAIFTTAFSEYAVDGFNLDAVDYLLKPFTIERFQHAVNKAQQLLSRKQMNTSAQLLVKVDYSWVKIDTVQILFIESLDDYLKIHLIDQKSILVRMTMKSILEKLPSHQFARIHRSYIVALQRIDQVRNKVIFINDLELPLGGSYEESFFQVFKG